MRPRNTEKAAVAAAQNKDAVNCLKHCIFHPNNMEFCGGGWVYILDVTRGQRRKFFRSSLSSCRSLEKKYCSIPTPISALEWSLRGPIYVPFPPFCIGGGGEGRKK